MTRIATTANQQIITRSMLDVQARLREAQQQLASGRKADTFAGIGPDAGRGITARGLSTQWEAHGKIARATATTLELYDANLLEMDELGTSLRAAVVKAVGSGQAEGLQQIAEQAWDRFRNALNASQGGVALFGGSRTGERPVAPVTLADTANKPLAEIFQNDDVKAAVRVAPDTDMSIGITASDVGSGLMQAFRSLAEMGPIGREPTAAQLDALAGVLKQIDGGLDTVRSTSSANGLRQSLLDRHQETAKARQDLFDGVAGGVEDADLGQVAVNIANYRTALEASYGAMARLQNLSLANYLR